MRASLPTISQQHYDRQNMQDIHSLAGGGTPRLFAAVAPSDRRLRHHHHPSNQALKCPRCDSLNTKFCYYNNYNLSQPRHFCKSCRRYWTKGGVLRNVPVGGGCRKSKRSSSSSSSSKPSSKRPPPTTPPSPSATTKPKTHDDDTNAGNHHSSSESSTLTASAAPTEIQTLLQEFGNPCLEKPGPTLYGVEDITIDHGGGGADDVSTSMLSGIGNFTSLMGSTTEMAPFGYAGVLTQHGHPQQQQHDVVVVDGFAPLDWQGGGDNNVDRGDGLFDMTTAVDQAYWGQQNQWTAADVVDHEQGGGGLFLP